MELSRLRTSPIVVLPDPPPPEEPMGLIAGGGRLPILVAQGMKAAGHTVHCVGLRGQYPPELPGLCDEFREVAPLKLGQWGRALRKFARSGRGWRGEGRAGVG
ncbi:MAG: hypothetical protein IBJ11_01795, partial [Phycisphaerales bacterium]|nr:hypothetical protein [Phycisphaerales bacterium]